MLFTIPLLVKTGVAFVYKVQGSKDFILPEAAQLTNQLIENSKLVFIDQSGHYPFMENKMGFC